MTANTTPRTDAALERCLFGTDAANAGPLIIETEKLECELAAIRAETREKQQLATDEFTLAHNTLNGVDMLLAEAGFKPDSSIRHQLQIAKSTFRDAERALDDAKGQTKAGTG